MGDRQGQLREPRVPLRHEHGAEPRRRHHGQRRQRRGGTRGEGPPLQRRRAGRHPHRERADGRIDGDVRHRQRHRPVRRLAHRHGGPLDGARYVRLMTPIADHESNMFSLHIYGYLYQGDVSAIDVRCSAYAYGDATSGGLIQKACTTVGTSLPVEITTEPSGATNNVVVRIGSLSTSWYYPYLAVEYDGWQIKDPAAFVWSVQSAVPAGAPALTNMNNVVIAPTNGGSIVVGQPGGTGTRLTVHGDAVVDGNLAAKYQDVAEWVPADASLATGTVVVLDRHAANRVTASTRAYDTGVAGVVSAKPGVILGEAGAEKAKIATTGRVRVKVDASHAAVGIGDLLVTRDTPGFAMKSEPLEMHGRSFHQPGTLIGKALEPLAAGKGEILVLLSLQ